MMCRNKVSYNVRVIITLVIINKFGSKSSLFDYNFNFEDYKCVQYGLKLFYLFVASREPWYVSFSYIFIPPQVHIVPQDPSRESEARAILQRLHQEKREREVWRGVREGGSE